MSYAGLLTHPLTIRRATFDDTDRDEAGQPARTVTTAPVNGLVQPRQGQGDERPDSRSAGAEIATHIVFLPYGTDVRHADAIDWGDRRLQIIAVRSYEFGSAPHLEVDARLITPTPVESGGS